MAMDEHDSYELLRFLSRLGHALLASGEAVGVIEDTLRRIAVTHGVRRVNVVALPTVLLVKFDDEQTYIDFTSEEGLTLRFDQIEEAFALARDAENPALAPAVGLARLSRILVKPPPHGPAWTIGGHVLITVAVSLLLQPTLGVIGSAAFFGLVVGVLKHLARGGGILNTLLPSIAAFVVVKHGLPASPLRVLIASLANFLPGGILAVATMDLAYGDVVSGASRLVTGLVQLIFLMLGMMVAVSVSGIPPAQLLVTGSAEPLGAWAPWLGVLLFGIGLALHFSVPLRSVPWMLLVLCVASIGQFVGNAAFGGYMSGFIAATMITPMAYLIQYRLGGPPAVITFQPALWLLVPAAIGLIGLAELVGDERLAGLTDFVTTLFAIIAVAVGCLIGSWIYNAFWDPIFRTAGSMAELVRSHLRQKQ
jgi:uncharacterized membrane protein YjjP (DUF1212 family)